MPDWLVFSLLASLLLTVGLNALLWLFPRIGQSAEQRFLARMDDHIAAKEGRPRARIIFPWKTMLFVSIIGTVLLNIAL